MCQPPIQLTATPVAGGWRLDGQAPWVTGWGVVDLLLVAARGPQDSVARLLVEAAGQRGLAAARLRLAAANASATVRLTFGGLIVPEDRCVGLRPFDPVRQQSEGLRSNGSLALGVARRCCVLIGPSALDDELSRCRTELDTAGTGTMPAARARASEFAARTAQVLAVTRAFADLAALSIAQHRASTEAQRLNEQLSGALTSRVVIEQAKGVISERAGVDLAEAFSRLRAYARSGNHRLTDVARAAIDGTLDPLAWAPHRPPPDHAGCGASARTVRVA